MKFDTMHNGQKVTVEYEEAAASHAAQVAAKAIEKAASTREIDALFA